MTSTRTNNPDPGDFIQNRQERIAREERVLEAAVAAAKARMVVNGSTIGGQAEGRLADFHKAQVKLYRACDELIALERTEDQNDGHD